MQNMKIEKLVRLALDCGLTGPDKRRQLMDGLPSGFVYRLPTVSRPIDQLRFDLIALDQPRLNGVDRFDRSPLAVWLDNAAMMCAGKYPDQAQVFAEASLQVYPEGRVMQRLAAAFAASSKAADSSTRSSSESMPRHKHLRVLEIHPDARWAWDTLDPPLKPQGRIHTVQTPRGSWHLKHAPGSTVWREVVENLDEALEAIVKTSSYHDYLGVFARLPEALGALLGSRLAGLEKQSSNPVIDHVICDHTAGWHPWGPIWSSPTMFDHLSAFRVEGLPRTTLDELTVVVEAGEGRLDPIRIDDALETVWASHSPKVLVSLERKFNPRPTPSTIERMIYDLNDLASTLRVEHKGLNKVHLFYQGPLPLMVRWAQTMHECPFRVVVYTEQSNRSLVPAVTLGEGQAADLVKEDWPSPLPVDSDVFILCHSANTPYAETMRKALTEEGLKVDIGLTPPMSTAPILALISPLTDSAWYHRVGCFSWINSRRGRLIPVLIEGAQARNLPPGLTAPFDANGKAAYIAGSQIARLIAD